MSATRTRAVDLEDLQAVLGAAIILAESIRDERLDPEHVAEAPRALVATLTMLAVELGRFPGGRDDDRHATGPAPSPTGARAGRPRRRRRRGE